MRVFINLYIEEFNEILTFTTNSEIFSFGVILAGNFLKYSQNNVSRGSQTYTLTQIVHTYTKPTL